MSEPFELKQNPTAQVQGPITYPAYPGSYQYTPAPAAVPAANEDGGQEHMRNAEEESSENKCEDDYEPASVPIEHLNLDFKECFHEHKSTKTFPHLYTCMGLMYKYTKLVVYHIFVIVFGIPLALLWAVINGLFAFIHVWIYGPALKATLLWAYAIIPLATVPLRALFTPLVDVGARIFRQIRIKVTLSGPVGEKVAERLSV